MKRCLSCYNTIDGSEIDFHWKCSKKIFGVTPPPELPFSEDNLQELATQIIQSQVTVTGVQPKISLHLPSTEHNSQVKRFTVVGMWGGFILKPTGIKKAKPFTSRTMVLNLQEYVKLMVISTISKHVKLPLLLIPASYKKESAFY